MYKIEIYTKNLCIFCDRAKNYFKSKNILFTEYNIQLNQDLFEEMLKRSNGQKTLPQIFINNQYIGGYEQLKDKINNGEFNKMITS